MTGRVLVLMGLPCLWLLATEARAESHDADGSNAERQLEGEGSVDAGAPAATELPAVPDFEAPRELKPEWTVLGTTRGLVPKVFAVVPNAGLTLREQPVLYWYHAGTAATAARFVLLSEAGTQLEETIPGPFGIGWQRIRLANYDAKLATGTIYSWSIGLVQDGTTVLSSSNVTAEILRIDPGDAFLTEVESASEQRRPFILAQRGVWYDAIDVLSEAVAAAPSDPGPRHQRTSLLRQVGLNQIVALEGKARGEMP